MNIYSPPLPKNPSAQALRVNYLLRRPSLYIWQTTGVELRPYQNDPIARIMDSIRHHHGDTIVLIFPRQSGKDEFLVNLKMYLADVFAPLAVGIVEVNPTYKPQTVTALMRFDRALHNNFLTRGKWRTKGDFMRIFGQCSISFLSGEGVANVVGASASLLMIVNEAQDISPDVYDRKFEPMAASTNATRIFAGTVWTSRTLLARERRQAELAEKADGRKRVYMIDANTVRQVVPWYGTHVDNVIRKQGREHPLVKTQYFNEEIDAEAGMFTPGRRRKRRTMWAP